MVILLPRLPDAAAEILLQQHMSDGFTAWPGFKPDDLPAAVRFAATGGSQVTPTQLGELRSRILQIARSNGFGHLDVRATHAKFDAELSASLADDSLFESGEALRDDVWTFVGTALAPDVVYWRFGVAPRRYLGGIRNTFQRLWLRGRTLDRGADHRDRWLLLQELTEDALVQITERPSLGGDPVLARAIAEAWLRASLKHGRGAMESIMRRAVLRVRIWNEIRSLAALPSEDLAGTLDDAFDISAGHGLPAAPKSERRVSEAGLVEGQSGFGDEGAELQRHQDAHEPLDDTSPSVFLVAATVRHQARKRGWLSPKALRALNVLEQGQRNLTIPERNAINYLLSRMQSANLLREEVSEISKAVE